MPRTLEENIAHLLRRAGFGASPEEMAPYVALGYTGAVDRLVNYELIPDDVDASIGRPGGDNHLGHVAQPGVELVRNFDAAVDPRVHLIEHPIRNDGLDGRQPLVDPPDGDLVAIDHAVVAV